MLPTLLLYLMIFLYGIVTGSFLNVCILRIPEGESIVSERSHCTKCSHVLHWYDLFPLFSYIFLRGKCRYCGAKISKQYPVVEALNGIMWVVSFLVLGWSLRTVCVCLLISALIVIAVIDFRTYEIPIGLNVAILVLGVAATALDFKNWPDHLIGAVCVSGFLLLLYFLTKGKGIGGGDIKLMCAAGLFLGWKLTVLAFLLGCLFGSVIHIIRMKVSKQGHVLAMGPYLAAGIVCALYFGQYVIDWYIGILL